jgi:hypothetical protein
MAAAKIQGVGSVDGSYGPGGDYGEVFRCNPLQDFIAGITIFYATILCWQRMTKSHEPA